MCLRHDGGLSGPGGDVSWPVGAYVGKVTPAAYTWNFQKETDGIFQDIQLDASRPPLTRRSCRSCPESHELSWYSNADELTRVASLIDDMGQKMCRLEAIRRVDTPWQRRGR